MLYGMPTKFEKGDRVVFSDCPGVWTVHEIRGGVAGEYYVVRRTGGGFRYNTEREALPGELALAPPDAVEHIDPAVLNRLPARGY